MTTLLPHILVCLHGKTAAEFYDTMSQLRAANVNLLGLFGTLVPGFSPMVETRFAQYPAPGKILRSSRIVIYFLDDSLSQQQLTEEWQRIHGHPRLVIKAHGGKKIRTHIWSDLLKTPAAAIEFF
jgi:hypothetical protein